MSSTPLLLPLYASSSSAPSTVVEVVPNVSDSSVSKYSTLTISLRPRPRTHGRHSRVRESFDMYMRSLDEFPLRTKMITVGCILMLSAALSSLLKDSDVTHLNFRLLLTLFTIGATFGSVPYHFLYQLLEQRFPTSTNKANVFVHVAIDQFLILPIYFIIYFLAKDVLMASFSITSFVHTISSNLWPVLKLSWCIYIASQTLNFAFVPSKLRIVVNSIVAFVVNALMAYFFLSSSTPHVSSTPSKMVHLLLAANS